MILAFLIIAALVASAFITGFIKDIAYRNITKEDIEDDVLTMDLVVTAMGVIVINNLVPFTLGALIGIYAIL